MIYINIFSRGLLSVTLELVSDLPDFACGNAVIIVHGFGVAASMPQWYVASALISSASIMLMSTVHCRAAMCLHQLLLQRLQLGMATRPTQAAEVRVAGASISRERLAAEGAGAASRTKTSIRQPLPTTTEGTGPSGRWDLRHEGLAANADRSDICRRQNDDKVEKIPVAFLGSYQGRPVIALLLFNGIWLEYEIKNTF